MKICQYGEGDGGMISYAPLWNTMQKRGATTYTLQFKGGVSSSSIRRLKAGESVSTNTLEALCKVLDCTIPEIIEYVPDLEGPPQVRDKECQHERR